MRDIFALGSRVLRRDGMRCQVCAASARPILAIHHVIPVSLGGRDISSNLITLCANCHRIVHWLAAGERSVDGHAYGLVTSASHRKQLLALARRIRRRRLREVGRNLVLASSVPLETAISAAVQRNGLERDEEALMRRCLKRALQAMAPEDRKSCAKRLVRGARFISINANNHLALRAPACSDRGQRYEEDIILAWPKGIRPSILSPSKFRRRSGGGFKLVPHITNLYLTWDECLGLSKHDWKLYRKACHDALTFAHSRRWTSNVTL
jgi:hypothetical protein